MQQRPPPQPQPARPAAPAPAMPPPIGVLVAELKGQTADGAPFVLHRIAGRITLLAVGGDYARPQAEASFRTLQDAPAVRAGEVQLVGLALRGGAGLAAEGHPFATVAVDPDGAFCKRLGVLGADGSFAPCLVLLDATMRPLASFPERAVAEALAAAEEAARALETEQAASFAPVLSVPRVFEPDLCRVLIDHYRQRGGEPSGFMREVDGRTVLASDTTHKRRSDANIEEGELRRQIQARINLRLVPMIRRAFSWQATRMERYIVARYGAEDAGFFRRHRDNTTKGTAHRKFAVTVNLNADGYDGGDLHFPEFGPRAYRATTGGAIVFGCDLLHEVDPVVRGERFAFLPFLYDEEGARIREANSHALADEALRYIAGPQPAEITLPDFRAA